MPLRLEDNSHSIPRSLCWFTRKIRDQTVLVALVSKEFLYGLTEQKKKTLIKRKPHFPKLKVN